jgi:ABC-type uncharacterized transport system permease subunit
MGKKPTPPVRAAPPVFLEHRSYRQRRLMDALRLLPLVGMLLWMVPVLWPVADSAGAVDAVRPIKMSQAVTYVFVVWLVLIVCAAGLWSRLTDVLTGKASKNSPETTDL